MRVRQKPKSYEAVQWRGDNEKDLIAFFPEGSTFIWGTRGVGVTTPYGHWFMYPQDWVLQVDDFPSYEAFNASEFDEQYEIIEPPSEENDGSD